MNTSLIIVCLLMVCIIFSPFFLFNSARKKNKTLIKAAITKNNLKISQEESWGNSYIGFDENQKKIVLLKFSDTDAVLEQLLDIRNLKEGKIIEKRKYFTVKDKKDSLLERLDLKVALNSGETILLNFFDADLKYKEDFELKRIEKWNAILHTAMLKNNPLEEVA